MTRSALHGLLSSSTLISDRYRNADDVRTHGPSTPDFKARRLRHYPELLGPAGSALLPSPPGRVSADGRPVARDDQRQDQIDHQPGDDPREHVGDRDDDPDQGRVDGQVVAEAPADAGEIPVGRLVLKHAGAGARMGQAQDK